MVLTARIDDFINIPVDKKAELHALCNKEGLAHVLTETHIVISPDLNHDPAAVQHYNDKVLTPYLRDNIKGCVEHIRISDGAPTQFKLADQALWIAKQKTTTGIKCDWVFRGTAHGKDLSDSECGTGVPPSVNAPMNTYVNVGA